MSELCSQNITYGGYAVALTKGWARTKGLNPVLYIDKNSQVATGISTLLKARQKRGKDKIPKIFGYLSYKPNVLPNMKLDTIAILIVIIFALKMKMNGALYQQ